MITTQKVRAQVRRRLRQKRGGGQVRPVSDLDDDVLREVAILRMEGYTTGAVAEQLGCSRRTVARQLALIRRILTADAGLDAESA
jgi:hypothetical protein